MEPIKKYRYKLIVEYDGSKYHGFQMQNENHIKTIEGQLTKAFKNFTQNDVEIIASGRTDSGVHAIAQTIHLDLSHEFSSHQMIMGINFYLKDEEIAVIDAEIVDENFSARFDAKMRHYRYEILNRKAPAIIEKIVFGMLAVKNLIFWRCKKPVNIYSESMIFPRFATLNVKPLHQCALLKILKFSLMILRKFMLKSALNLFCITWFVISLELWFGWVKIKFRSMKLRAFWNRKTALNLVRTRLLAVYIF